jgi:hypothetical protein
MTRLVAALGLALLAGLTPASGWAQETRSDMGRTGHRHPHRPRPPFVHRPHPVIPCCLGLSYRLPEPPPVIVPAPPPVIFFTPAPPSLVYVAPPRVEPAPEIQLPNGRWERHGNGKEYPYTWVWVGAPPAR